MNVQVWSNHSRAHLLVALLAILPARTYAQAPAAKTNDSALQDARSLLLEHHPQQAEVILGPLLTRDPADVPALLLLAQARLQEGDRTEARALLTRALSVKPESPEVNNALGEIFLQDHLYPEAMDRFEAVLGMQRTNSEARKGELSAATELALTAKRADHPDVALQVLQHALTRLPDDPQLLFEAGTEAYDLHRLDEASNALNAARKLDAHNLDLLYALAQLEIDQQHMSAAEADFRAYLALRPTDASAHFGLGHVLAMVEHTEEARTEFERSIQLQPVQTEAYYQIGQIELDAQHDGAAEPLFRRVLARNPNHGGALTGMGILAFRAKDYAGADRQLAAAEKTAPDYGPAHYYRGLALARLGRKKEAEDELLRATQPGKGTQPSSADSP